MTSDTSSPQTAAPSESAADAPSELPNQLQDAIRARALSTIARDETIGKRSPRQLFIAALLMLVAVSALLFVINLGVRTMHRILDLWFPAHTQPQPDVTKPYLITLDPAAPEEPTASRSASSSQSANKQ